jgi:Na+/H+-dicarboxylate symporter
MSQRDRTEDGQRTKRGFSLTTLILAGLVLGLVWGLFFGEYGAWIKWIGDVYVGLLQMTVLVLWNAV